MKTTTKHNNKNRYSIAATLRSMPVGRAFRIPVGDNIANAYALAHTGAKQLSNSLGSAVEIAVRQIEGNSKEIRVHLVKAPANRVCAIPFPLEPASLKMAAAKSGRPAGTKNKVKTAPAKSKSAKKSAPVKSKASTKAKVKAAKASPVKNIKTARAVLTPAK